MGPFLADSLPRSRFVWIAGAVLAVLAGSALVCAPEAPATPKSLIRPTHCYQAATRAPIDADFEVDQIVVTKVASTITMRCVITLHGRLHGEAHVTASTEASAGELAMTRNACITAAVEDAAD
ncbi:MAG: hypothetical protein ABI867_44215 [Kofleriaceae bacterium]